MKFGNEFNKQFEKEEKIVHSEDFEVEFESVLADLAEIKKLDEQYIVAEESYLLALEAYDYHKASKNKGKTITANDLSLLVGKLEFAAKQVGIDSKTLVTHTEAFKVHSENNPVFAFDVVAEGLGATLSKIFEAIKNMIIKISDLIRGVYVKLLNIYPMLQSNLNKIITYLSDRINLPRKQLNRVDLKWIVNKAPAIFALAKDSGEILAFLSNKRRKGSIGSIYDDAIQYGNAILQAKSVKDETSFVNSIKKITDHIMSSPDSSIYSKLQHIIPEISKEKGKVCIYRADGRTIKYRVLTQDGEENGVPIIKSQIKSIIINPTDEEQIRIGKIYTPQEVIAIAHGDVTYISEIRNYYSGLSTVIDSSKKMINGIEGLMSTGLPASEGTKSVVLRNFFNLARSGLGLLNSDILLCYYNTARDVYYAVYKYADLWYGKGDITFQDKSEKKS